MKEKKGTKQTTETAEKCSQIGNRPKFTR